MPIILLALVLFVVLAFGGVVLLSLALRYRAGTARRQARRWVARLNLWMTAISAVLYLFFAFLMSFWLGPTLRFALIGMVIGSLLGLLGLAVTKWDVEAEGLFYTPSRWLALLVTFAIAARFLYGWWRTTHADVGLSADQQQWVMAASGTQLSLAFGGGLIGYYFVYAIGVRLRLKRHLGDREPRSSR
ncbi:MAG: hypothetical protein ACJ8KU_00600 [Chthoniobacterales bacterium]